MSRKTNVTKKNLGKFPKAEKYEVTVSGITKTLLLGKKITFKNVNHSNISIKPKSIISNEKIDILVEDHSGEKIIVIATIADLPT